MASHTHVNHIGCHHEFDHRVVHQLEADLMATPERKAVRADPYVTDDISDTPPSDPHLSER